MACWTFGDDCCETVALCCERLFGGISVFAFAFSDAVSSSFAMVFIFTLAFLRFYLYYSSLIGGFAFSYVCFSLPPCLQWLNVAELLQKGGSSHAFLGSTLTGIGSLGYSCLLLLSQSVSLFFSTVFSYSCMYWSAFGEAEPTCLPVFLAVNLPSWPA